MKYLLTDLKKMLTLKRYICPVCGYPKLINAPFQYKDKKNGITYHSYLKGTPSYEICPSCEIEFGYDDYYKNWELLRKEWKYNGMPWSSIAIRQPLFWNPERQLENIAKITELEEYKRQKLIQKNRKLKCFVR